jgi:hypothetical protein
MCSDDFLHLEVKNKVRVLPSSLCFEQKQEEEQHENRYVRELLKSVHVWICVLMDIERKSVCIHTNTHVSFSVAVPSLFLSFIHSLNGVEGKSII